MISSACIASAFGSCCSAPRELQLNCGRVYHRQALPPSIAGELLEALPEGAQTAGEVVQAIADVLWVARTFGRAGYCQATRHGSFRRPGRAWSYAIVSEAEKRNSHQSESEVLIAPAGFSTVVITLECLMKRLVFVAITAAIAAALLELFSSLFLFRYHSAKEAAFVPTGSSTIYLAEKALRISPFAVTPSIDNPPLYIMDSDLGFTTLPGQYRIGFTAGTKTRFFHYTVAKRGIRATSYKQTHRPHSIFLFGDSVVLGWGNNDEHSMPWLLQAKFPNYNVLNFAQTGYGITHALIQYRAMADRVTPDDLVILPYADYYLARNYGAPSWIRTLSNGLENNLGGKKRLSKAVYPVARSTKDGDLAIEYIQISCELNDGYCERPDPPQSEMIEATKASTRFLRKMNPEVVLAYLNGADGDPVVKYAREIGLRVIDIRLDQGTPEWDDFGQFDAHPGPTAQYNYFRKLSKALIEDRIIVP